MSAIENYLAANSRWNAAKAQTAAIAQALKQVSELLTRQPEQIVFANSNVGLPAEIVMNSHSISIDAKTWPMPDDIQASLAERYAARKAVVSAWSDVPSELKSGLVPPKF